MTIKDPMILATEEKTRILFEKVARECNGFSTDAVVGAALNLLVNAIRQNYTSKQVAESRFDELMYKSKAVLMDHYDSAGRKKGLFPFVQHINPVPFANGNKFGGR